MHYGIMNITSLVNNKTYGNQVQYFFQIFMSVDIKILTDICSFLSGTLRIECCINNKGVDRRLGYFILKT